MTKAERIAALIANKETPFTAEDQATLEACSDVQLEAIEKQDRGGRIASLIAGAVPAPAPAAETPKVAAEVKPEPVAEVKAAAAKEPTTEEYLAAAPAAIREQLASGLRTAAAQKTATITQLKASGRCSIPDARLASMSQEELNQLVTLAAVPAVDFSLQGGPRAANTNTNEAPAAPDLVGAIRAARAAKK